MENPEYRGRAGGVQVGRRLIEHEETRRDREHPRNRDPLLLAAGESRGPAALEPRQPDEPEHFRHSRAHRDHGPGEILQTERDVVPDALHHELARRILEHDPRPEAHGRHGRNALNVARGDFDVVDTERALPLAGKLDGQQPRQPARDRALPGPGWPDDEEQLARLHSELQITERRPRAARVRKCRAIGRDGARRPLPQAEPA